MAKPHGYTPEIGAELLRRFSGGEFIKAICRDAHMPHRDTVYSWLSDPRPELVEFRRLFKLAEVAHSYALADDVIEIADGGSRDRKLITRADGSEYEVVDNEVLGRSKLRVDVRMKLMGKRAPAIFGDNIGISGPGGEPIQIEDKGDGGMRDLGRRLAFTLAAGLRIAQQKQIEAEAEDVSDGAENVSA